MTSTRITTWPTRTIYGPGDFGRMLDGIDPALGDELHPAAGETPGVLEVAEVRVHWLGLRLLAEPPAAECGWHRCSP